jgi:hypothetical protein
MRGNTDASTTRNPVVPRTWNLLSSTAFGSLAAPIGHAHEAWWPQGSFLKKSEILPREFTPGPGITSS